MACVKSPGPKLDYLIKITFALRWLPSLRRHDFLPHFFCLFNQDCSFSRLTNVLLETSQFVFGPGNLILEQGWVSFVNLKGSVKLLSIEVVSAQKKQYKKTYSGMGLSGLKAYFAFLYSWRRWRCHPALCIASAVL